MKKNMTHTEAFRYFGIKLRNVRYSWSGVSDDGLTVALSLFRHELGMIKGRYSFLGKIDMTRQGGRDVIKDLQHAVIHLDGRVHVVENFARDEKVDNPTVAYSRPATFTMKVAYVDLQKGEYLLQIELPDQIAA